MDQKLWKLICDFSWQPPFEVQTLWYQQGGANPPPQSVQWMSENHRGGVEQTTLLCECNTILDVLCQIISSYHNSRVKTQVKSFSTKLNWTATLGGQVHDCPRFNSRTLPWRDGPKQRRRLSEPQRFCHGCRWAERSSAYLRTPQTHLYLAWIRRN